MSASVQARVALAAFAATLLSALTLTPLVQGLGWFVAVVVVVALSSGVGASMRQVTQQPAIVIAAQLAMFAITVTALFARDAAVWGVLPGPDAVHALQQLVADGMDVTRHDGPPVEATRGVLLLVAGGVGLVGLLTDVIAVTLRRPAVAGLPLLAVYCVPAAVLPGGLPWVYFLLSATGYLVLVGADAGERVHGWGRVLSGAGTDPNGAGLGGPLSGARRVAGACLAIAVVVPALVPGLGERLIGASSATGLGSGHGTTISVVNPILDLRADLQSRSNETVIRYTTDTAPQPLRIVTDDQFTGTVWQPSTGSLARSQLVTAGLPPAPGLGPGIATTAHSTRISVLNLAQTYLPLPYPTTKVAIDGRWLWDAGTLNVVGEGVTTANRTYTADYLVVEPTAGQLAAAGKPPGTMAKYVALPKSLPASIAQQARTVAGSGTPYDQAVRLQNWFRSGGGFTYSETLGGNGRGDSGQDAVAAFLRDRKGYCVQFASAMAVMARTLGIPARVAVGFLPGTAVDAKTYTISLRDAHAWPELYFDGVGWVRFEPTPATRTGAPPSWTLPQTPAPNTVNPSASAATGPSAQPSARIRPDQAGSGGGAGSSPSGISAVLRAVPWRLLGVLALVLLLLATPKLAAVAARRRRWARAGTPVERAEAAWDDLRLSLQDLSVGWASSWTPRALQVHLVGERDLDEPAREALARLVADLESARYAPPGSLVRTAEDLRADVRRVVAAVAPTVPAARRRRAVLMPASGLAALTGMVRSVDAAANQAGARASELGSQLRRSVGPGSGRD
jgi:transglutaminase-like putative cysteine protease